MLNKLNNDWREAGLQFWVLAAFLVLVFFVGGSARADVQSLALLRPFSIGICGFALWTIRREHLASYKWLFVAAGAVFAYVSLYLVPLPPSIWNDLPGRSILQEIDKSAALGHIWRPLSISPGLTWNSFYSLFTPLAVFLLGAQITRTEKFLLLPVLLALGVLSGLWGLLQSINNSQEALYLYRITNKGFAVGLFANRNHQAILLSALFPILAVYASNGVRSVEQGMVKAGIALAVGVVLVPLLLVTGSRAGLVIGFLGLASIIFVYRTPKITTPKKRKLQKFNQFHGVIIFGVIMLAATTILMSRAEAVRRLIEPGQFDDLRLQAWKPIADAAVRFFPIGTGPGTFVPVYQLVEPTDLLRTGYLNQAHNDWLDLLLTGGAVGATLVIFLIAGFARLAWSALRADIHSSRDVVFARLGIIIVVIFAAASIVDYPLRTPALGSVFVVALLWLTGNCQSPFKRTGSV